MKKYEQNTPELIESIKRPTVQIMGIEEDIHTKGIGNKVNKVIAKTLQILRNDTHQGIEHL
jgi:hypothetical protein